MLKIDHFTILYDIYVYLKIKYDYISYFYSLNFFSDYYWRICIPAVRLDSTFRQPCRRHLNTTSAKILLPEDFCSISALPREHFKLCTLCILV